MALSRPQTASLPRLVPVEPAQADPPPPPEAGPEPLAALFEPARPSQPRGLGSLFLTDAHRQVAESLLRAVEEGTRLIVLSGEPGIGKSTLLQGVLLRLRDPKLRILRQTAPIAAGAVLLPALGRRPEREHTLLAIDSAEALAPRTLRYLLARAERSGAQGPPLQLLLTGRPELLDRLRATLADRAIGRTRLELRLSPLSPADAVRYVEHRVMRSGYPVRQVMEPGAVRIIAQQGGGVPARLDALLDASVKVAGERQEAWITAPVARAAIRPAALSGVPKRGTGLLRFAALGSVVAAVAVGAFEIAPGDVGPAREPAGRGTAAIAAADGAAAQRPAGGTAPMAAVVPVLSSTPVAASPDRASAGPGEPAGGASLAMRAGAASPASGIDAGPQDRRGDALPASAPPMRLAEVIPGPEPSAPMGSQAAPIGAPDQGRAANGTSPDRPTPTERVPVTSTDRSGQAASDGSPAPNASQDASQAVSSDQAARPDHAAPPDQTARSREVAPSTQGASSGQAAPSAIEGAESASGGSRTSAGGPGGASGTEEVAPGSGASPGSTADAGSASPGGSSAPAPGAAASAAPASPASPDTSLPAAPPATPADTAASSPATGADAAPSASVVPAPSGTAVAPAPEKDTAGSDATPRSETATKPVEPTDGAAAPATSTAQESPAATEAGRSASDRSPGQAAGAVGGAAAPARTAASTEPQPGSDATAAPAPAATRQAPDVAPPAGAPPATEATAAAQSPTERQGSDATAPAQAGGPASAASAPAAPASVAPAAAAPSPPAPAGAAPAATATATTSPSAPPVAPAIVPPGTSASGTEAAPAQATSAAIGRSERAPAPAASPATRSAPLAPEIVATLMRRGEVMRGTGDISAARLLFDRAAEAGSGRAALEAGRLRDPAWLTAAGAIGVAPDPRAAAAWYRRAIDLGEPEARPLLQRLEEAQR
ncbi:MAG: hypothetical protein J0H19_22135 [Rhodospirillales bacterium]|nr:hypothetical protein [Rhodospirillales bacterium]